MPHPFVLRMVQESHRTAPLRLEPGDEAALELGLVASAIGHLPALTAALDGLGEGGIGRPVSQESAQARNQKRRGTLRIRQASLRLSSVSLRLYDGGQWRLPRACSPTLYEQVGDLMEPPPPADGETLGDGSLDGEALGGEAPENLEVTFETPARIGHQGTLLTTPAALTSEALAQACYRRWAALSLCYGPDPPSTERLDAAFKQARSLGRDTQIRKRALQPISRTRYSARQDQRLTRTGLQGSVRIAGPAKRLAQWRWWLRRIAPIHVGKSTAMGFGILSVDA
ncbi:CRISPR system precrRNA processing endoribonuclease RAMP protein Cas6 [Salinibacter sp.]|uniref:CRISPR system precrRNA processing endoribonuclease RAMP protein Cas6 n=1 Tax=Salinibacter sp. TaxID=2065818 RepID=UPI0021E89A59|nr:CRISPR system precrRNA processing endoribonuclease RAMP protein Cas6 [Salinibacter sp.]